MKKLIVILGITTLFIIGCGAPSESASNQNASEFASTIADPNVVILDVRTAGEYAEGHIANSINIDVEGGQFDSAITQLDKSKSYAVYCRSGRRSVIAVDEMKKIGFTSLFNLNTGVNDWVASGKPLVTK